MSTTSVTLFGHWICPFSVRVEFALAQRGIAYDVVDVPPSAVRPKGFVVPQEFIDHSPKLEVPMVRIGGDYLADSIPILEWLEEKFSDAPLMPAAVPQQTVVRERVQWLDRNLYRPMIGVYYGVDSDKIARASEHFGVALGTVAQWLSDSAWLAGDVPTLAEAIMAGVYTRMNGLQHLGLTCAVPENVAYHADRMKDLTGWQRVEWSDAQTTDFVGRFLKYREIQSRQSQ